MAAGPGAQRVDTLPPSIASQFPATEYQLKTTEPLRPWY